MWDLGIRHKRKWKLYTKNIPIQLARTVHCSSVDILTLPVGVWQYKDLGRMDGLKNPRQGAENVVPAVVMLVDLPSLEGTIQKNVQNVRLRPAKSRLNLAFQGGFKHLPPSLNPT